MNVYLDLDLDLHLYLYLDKVRTWTKPNPCPDTGDWLEAAIVTSGLYCLIHDSHKYKAQGEYY